MGNYADPMDDSGVSLSGLTDGDYLLDVPCPTGGVQLRTDGGCGDSEGRTKW